MHVHVVVGGVARHSDVGVRLFFVDDIGCIQLERHLVLGSIQISENADRCANAVIGINEMVQDRGISHCQVVGKMGCRGGMVIRLRFEDDGQMVGYLLDETLGNVRQRGFSLDGARHYIALHYILAFPILQLLGLEHDAVQMVFV